MTTLVFIFLWVEKKIVHTHIGTIDSTILSHIACVPNIVQPYRGVSSGSMCNMLRMHVCERYLPASQSD